MTDGTDVRATGPGFIPATPPAAAASRVKVDIGGWAVDPVGITTAGLRTTGMWGEPAERAVALRTITRAVELGAELIEVPVPFGPWADLIREADPEGVVIAARLAGPARGIDDLRRHLGPRQRVALVLAEAHHLDEVRGWDVDAVGVVAGPTSSPSTFGDVAAVRGPYPAPRRVVDWCAARGVAYLAPAPEILRVGPLVERPAGASPLAVTLLTVRSSQEVDRAFAAAAELAGAAGVGPPDPGPADPGPADPGPAAAGVPTPPAGEPG